MGLPLFLYVLSLYLCTISDCANEANNRDNPKLTYFRGDSDLYGNVTDTNSTKYYSQRRKHVVAEKPTYPVILMPGDGGNQLAAVLNRTNVTHVYCTKHAEEFTLWLDLEELLPLAINCFTDNIRLIYDPKTRQTHSPPGVTITVPGFGDTESVEWIDPSHLSFGRYFVGIVDYLVERGYERGKSIRGAPFDFRKAPNTEAEYFKKLKALIEETYSLNNNQKVVIITHSLGGIYGLYFLNHMPKSWKDQYIRAYAPIAAPFAGAVKVMRLLASGDDLDEKVINPLVVRPAQRTYPSSTLLMPSDRYWAANEVLVITPKKNYTVSNYKEFFSDIKYNIGMDMREDTKNLVYNLTAPDVPVFHVHGKGMRTPEKFLYDDIFQFPDDQPHVIHGPGDGTVNMRSFKAFLKWRDEQSQPVEEHEIEGGQHLAILQMPELHQYLYRKVLQPW